MSQAQQQWRGLFVLRPGYNGLQKNRADDDGTSLVQHSGGNGVQALVKIDEKKDNKRRMIRYCLKIWGENLLF